MWGVGRSEFCPLGLKLANFAQKCQILLKNWVKIAFFSKFLEFVHKKCSIALFSPWWAKKSIITFFQDLAVFTYKLLKMRIVCINWSFLALLTIFTQKCMFWGLYNTYLRYYIFVYIQLCLYLYTATILIKISLFRFTVSMATGA